jgi:hypothetical protein
VFSLNVGAAPARRNASDRLRAPLRSLTGNGLRTS